jgi:hypothetical protein
MGKIGEGFSSLFGWGKNKNKDADKKGDADEKKK